MIFYYKTSTEWGKKKIAYKEQLVIVKIANRLNDLSQLCALKPQFMQTLFLNSTL